MANNQLNLTTPVTYPALKYVRVAKAGDIVGSAKQLTLVFEILADEGLTHPIPFSVLLSDYECDRLVVNPAPTSTIDVFILERVRVDEHPELTEIFEQALMAYVGAPGNKENALLNLLQSKGLIPAGAATDE